MSLRYYRFEALLQREDWLTPAYVGVDAKGTIVYLSNEPPQDGVSVEAVLGYALPGMQNAHSHAFQYAMAGLAEVHSMGADDDFWSWREEMYKIALAVSPDQVEAIATMLYAEMLRHGYTHVAEFHYLHHGPDGKPYTHLAEMGERLVAAAATAGINITLVPVFYQRGGFGAEPQPRQRRFISSSTDAYLKLLDASRDVVKKYEGAQLGYCVHSLRAVDLKEIPNVIAGSKDLPFHIHVAEQQKEVSDCKTYSGLRPAQWLIDNAPLDDRCHLVHATHLDDQEIQGIAKSGARVVLCPSTEGNLGDGFFRMSEYREAEGRWSIGTDSHIGLNPFEELRMIDYRERLKKLKRNTLGQDAARYMVMESVASGRAAMGSLQVEHFAPGQYFDAMVMDATAPLLHAISLEKLLATIVFASDPAHHFGTIVRGKWMVRGGRHHHGASIRKNFFNAVRSLRAS